MAVVLPEGSVFAGAPAIAIAASAEERCGDVARPEPVGAVLRVDVNKARSFVQTVQRAVPIGLHVSH